MRALSLGLVALLGLALPGLVRAAEQPVGQVPESKSHEVQRLHFDPPELAHLGTAFDVVVDSPPELIGDIVVSQSVEHPMVRHAEDEHAKIVVLANGTTVARVVPLMQGHVSFSLVAAFKDSGVELQTRVVEVGTASVPPRQIVGDRAFLTNAYANKDVAILARVGWRNGEFHPVGIFDALPDFKVDLQNLATFRLIPGNGPPVVVVTEDGRFATLRPGLATISVSYAGASSTFQIQVSP